jgi:cyclophilin family peptidyl-prolyl cis-trans isomerase
MKKILLISTLFLTISCGITKQTEGTRKEPAKPEVKTAKKESAKVDTTSNRMVLIHTDMGDMKVRLSDATPQHRDNFLSLARNHFFDSLLFHRVIRNFMIQGGDPQSRTAPAGQMLGNGDVGYTIPAEFVDSLFHKKGMLCAARTENPEKASSGCQFYIVQGTVLTDEQIKMVEMRTGHPMTEQQKLMYKTIGGTPQLDHSYTVFGEVVEGLDVIDKIAAVQTSRGDRPLTDVRMVITVIK